MATHPALAVSSPGAKSKKFFRWMTIVSIKPLAAAQRLSRRQASAPVSEAKIRAAAEGSTFLAAAFFK
jgi:hypothetical protein